MSPDILRKVMEQAGVRADTFAQPLTDAMQRFSITTARRQAAFLAQIAHETAQLHYMKEIADGSAYEGRADLGNVQPGDGKRYPGRGGLMATGRGIAIKLSKELGANFEDNPSLLEMPNYAMMSAGWIWTVDKQLNELADADHFGTITHRINGGYNGLDSRLALWLLARKALDL